VDITINKASDMIKTVFIQQSILALDNAFGTTITKKAILLGKWLCSSSNILGSKAGRLPSCAIEVAILFVLNTIPLINTSQASITNVILSVMKTFMLLKPSEVITICGNVESKKV